MHEAPPPTPITISTVFTEGGADISIVFSRALTPEEQATVEGNPDRLQFLALPAHATGPVTWSMDGTTAFMTTVGDAAPTTGDDWDLVMGDPSEAWLNVVMPESGTVINHS